MRPQSATELLAALDAAGASSAVEHSHIAGSIRSRKRVLIGGVAVVGLGLVALGAYRVVTSRLSMPRSVAVLPFEIVGPDTAFADGMADQLSAELTKVPGLNVVVRSSSYTLRHAGANAGHFGADAVITGSVQHDSATRRFRVTARLARVRDNSVLWSDNFTENAADIFDVQDRMAQAITARVRSTLGPNAAGGSAGADQQRSARSGAGTRNAEANDLYVRGAYFVQRRGPWVQNAVSAFEQAIAKDSGFARAWAGLSEALSLLPYYVNVDPRPTFERAFAVAQHAVALEPNLAEARAVLGRAYAALYRNEEAAAEYRKAVAIDPMYAKGQLWYGQQLVISGYPQAGFQATRRSAELDPYWFQPARQLSQVLLILGRHEEALIEARRAWQLDSTNSGVWRDLARVHFQSGRLDSAHVALNRMSQTPSPNTWAVILYLTARLGMPDSARRMMRRLEADSSTNRSFHAASLAFGYLGLGDTTRALDWLEQSARRGEPVIFTLPLGSTEYDPIRSSARFAKVARAFGFDPAPLTGHAEASKR